MKSQQCQLHLVIVALEMVLDTPHTVQDHLWWLVHAHRSHKSGGIPQEFGVGMLLQLQMMPHFCSIQ